MCLSIDAGNKISETKHYVLKLQVMRQVLTKEYIISEQSGYSSLKI